jgi:hypothetical protein
VVDSGVVDVAFVATAGDAFRGFTPGLLRVPTVGVVVAPTWTGAGSFELGFDLSKLLRPSDIGQLDNAKTRKKSQLTKMLNWSRFQINPTPLRPMNPKVPPKKISWTSWYKITKQATVRARGIRGKIIHLRENPALPIIREIAK